MRPIRIGDRVRVVSDSPWRGQVGVVVSGNGTIFGIEIGNSIVPVFAQEIVKQLPRERRR